MDIALAATGESPYLDLADAAHSFAFYAVGTVFLLLGVRLVRLPSENLRGVIEVFGAFLVIMWSAFCLGLCLACSRPGHSLELQRMPCWYPRVSRGP
jgi:hypothetical protein